MEMRGESIHRYARAGYTVFGPFRLKVRREYRVSMQAYSSASIHLDRGREDEDSESNAVFAWMDPQIVIGPETVDPERFSIARALHEELCLSCFQLQVLVFLCVP